ncbi:hypothetical protein L9F63_013947, partial [Diploptera punctata]
TDDITDSRDVETPPKKKLKQARLPFQILSPEVESPPQPLKNKNKRKLESSDDVKTLKIIRTNESSQLCETKENVHSPSVSSDYKKVTDPKFTTNQCATKVSGNSENEVNKSETINSQINGKTTIKTTKTSDNKSKAEIKLKQSSEDEDSVNLIVISDSEDSLLNSSNADKSSLTSEQKKVECDIETTDPTLHLHLSDDEESETEKSPSVVITTFEGTVNKIDSGNSGGDKSEKCAPKSNTKLHNNNNSTKTYSSAENTPKNKNKSDKSPSISSAQKNRKLTPKQLQKQLESAKKKEEKEKIRQVWIL